jgi:hypothetical protein
MRSFACTTALPCLLAATLLCFAPASPAQTQPPIKSQVPSVAGQAAPIQFPLSFEPNQGQDSEDVRFTAAGPGYTLQLHQRSAVVQFASAQNQPTSSVELELLNSNPLAEMTGATQLPGVTNYIPARDSASWHTGVPKYNRVEYDQIYPGTGLSFYAHQRSLEYDFRLQPGADAGKLLLAIRGADKASLDADGNLVLASAGREIRFLKPVAYQPLANGARNNVSAHYTLMKTHSPAGQESWLLAFEVGPHDSTRELVIDPVLSYGAILPATDSYIGGIASDATGNLYVTGYNQQRGFYLAKFDVNGTNLFTTVIGSGGAYAVPVGIAVDSTGKIYVTGYSNTGLPTTANAYLNYTGTHYIAFVAVFPSTGTAPSYLSYFGGTKSTDYASGIAFDSTGKFYIAGDAASSDFPTTPGAYLTTNPYPGNYAAFVAKFDPTKSGTASLVYSTLLGNPNNQTLASAIAVDSSANAYVTIQSSQGYPITAGALTYKGTYATSYSTGAFLTKLNPTGTALAYSAFLGPGIPTSVQVDGASDAYVTGSVQADDFPTTTGAYQTSYPGGFVSELNPTGSALVYSTFLSGPSGAFTVSPQQIVIPTGCASLCPASISGYTSATDFPAIAAIQSTIGGSPSPFLVSLAGNGASATFSSYLGGLTASTYLTSSNPIPLTPSVAIGASGSLYFAAYMSGNDFPTTLPLPASQSASYIAKINPAAGALVVATPTVVNFDNFGVTEVVGVSSTLNPNPDNQAVVNPVQVTLRNMGSTAVAISSIALSPATEFSETDQCSLTIPAGGTCVLNLAFDPSAAGKRTANLLVTSNAANSPLTIPLSGTASAAAFLQTSVTTLTFADLAVGSTSASQVVTLTNIGKTLANLQPIPPTPQTINGSYGFGTDFQVLDTCPAQLLPGASCNIGVTFSPIASGFREAYFTVPSDAAGNPEVILYGSGLAGNYGSLALSATVLNFNTQLIKTTSTQQIAYLTNTSNSPITIYSVTVATRNQTTGSDFALTGGNCISATPFYLRPQASCAIYLRYTPTIVGAETGTVTINDSVVPGPQTIALSGIGLAAAQALEFSPGNYAFPDQPLNIASTGQLIYVYNTSTAPVAVDRVLVSGDFQIISTNCPGATLRPGPAAGVDTNPDCSVRITFTPTALGSRTGTLSFVDSAGATQVLNLTGNGIAFTGGVLVEPSSLVFPVQAIGTTSTTQHININNPGNGYTTVNSITTTGNYAIVNVCATTPFTLNSLANCGVDISFTPMGTTNPHPGSLVVNSTGGTATTAISGTGITAATAVGLTPTALAFGNVQVGVVSFTYNVYFRNTGTTPVTLTSIASTGDFANNGGSCGFYGNTLAPGTSCYVQVSVTPTAAGARTGTLTLIDSAGTQTAALTATGTAAIPPVLLNPGGLTFNQQTVNTTSAGQIVYFSNNGATPLVISTAAITAGGTSYVVVPNTDHCTGVSIAANSYCSIQLQFSPSAAGYTLGTLTFTDSKANKYLVPIAGYATALTVSAYVDPTGINFPGQVLTTTSSNQSFSLYNSGDTPLTVGTLTGTGTIVGASTTGVFSTNSAQGGSDNCSGVTVAVGSHCTVYVTFTPATAVASTGTITVPVTYSNSTTGSFVVTLAGTGLAVKDSVELTPVSLAFPDQALNAQYGAGTDPIQYISLANTGNLPVTVGNLTSTNVVIGTTATGDFTTNSAYGGYDGCSGQQVAPRSTCYISVAFTPIAVGARAGSVVFPVTYADNTKASLTGTLSGKGVAATSTIVVTPTVAQFNSQVVGTTSASDITVTISNTGNQPVKIATATLTSSFSFAGDSCSGTTLGIASNCTITVAFSPTTTGAITGTLTIPDNSTGNPHKVVLSGTGLAATQQIVLSQTALNFGTQLAGSRGAGINVFVTNQSSTNVTINTITLGGVNAADYLESNGCAGSVLSGNSTCAIAIYFNPAAASIGVRNATVVETDTASGSPRTITLTGTGLATEPRVAFYPASLNFGTQGLGTQSAPLTFSVTNTGAANLVVSTLVSSNPAEFPITSNTCAGKTIAAGANCLVSVAFKPNSGSTQTATISIADNVTPSPQTVTVTGVSVGIPQATLSPLSLNFGSVGVGIASTTQAITLANAGTDILKIASVAITGTNPTDFTQTNTCATQIAAGASCVITVTFKPTATGARAAAISVTDNAGNTVGSTQTATLAGTGTGVAKVAFSPTSLTFAATYVGSASATQNIAMANSGTSPLTFTLAITGANATDFTDTTTCVSPLAAGTNCAITVTFKPTAAGARAAAISVTDNAAASPQTIALAGTAVGIAKATASTTALTFASQAVGVASGAQTVTVTNSGSAPLIVASLAISGTNATDFKATSTTCPGTIAIAANCGIAVTFTPTAAGTRTATLTITDNNNNATGSTQTVTLTGTGAGIPKVTIAPASFAFASETVGSAEGPLSVTLTNSGTGPLSVASIKLAGTNATDFLEFDTCIPTVATGASCEIALYFVPKAAGARTASVIVTDNANNVANSTQTIPITATATGTPTIAFSATSLVYAAQKVGSLSAGKSITISNTGTAPLTVTSVALSGANPADYMQFNTCTSVGAGDTCVLAVFFLPTATGTRTANVVFTDNANGVANATQAITLSGTGN